MAMTKSQILECAIDWYQHRPSFKEPYIEEVLESLWFSYNIEQGNWQKKYDAILLKYNDAMEQIDLLEEEIKDGK